MASAITFTDVPTLQPQRSIFKAILSGLAAGWEAWRNYQQVERELNSLTTRELADLGITRNDIPAVAARRFNVDTAPRGLKAVA